MRVHQPLRKNIPLYIGKVRHDTISHVAAERGSNLVIILRWYSLLLLDQIKVILKKLKLLIIVSLDLNKQHIPHSISDCFVTAPD